MTREDAIRILEVNKPVMTKRASMSERKYVEAFDMAISALKESKGEWIPVSEKLPKAFETVLRTRVENGWNGTTYTIVDTGCICPAEHNIVAWMPLPEPYKAEKPETCKGCLEPCIMYEPDMRACKKKVKAESEDK